MFPEHLQKVSRSLICVVGFVFCISGRCFGPPPTCVQPPPHPPPSRKWGTSNVFFSVLHVRHGLLVNGALARVRGRTVGYLSLVFFRASYRDSNNRSNSSSNAVILTMMIIIIIMMMQVILTMIVMIMIIIVLLMMIVIL